MIGRLGKRKPKHDLVTDVLSIRISALSQGPEAEFYQVKEGVPAMLLQGLH